MDGKRAVDFHPTGSNCFLMARIARWPSQGFRFFLPANSFIATCLHAGTGWDWTVLDWTLDWTLGLADGSPPRQSRGRDGKRARDRPTTLEYTDRPHILLRRTGSRLRTRVRISSLPSRAPRPQAVCDCMQTSRCIERPPGRRLECLSSTEPLSRQPRAWCSRPCRSPMQAGSRATLRILSCTPACRLTCTSLKQAGRTDRAVRKWEELAALELTPRRHSEAQEWRAPGA